MKTNTPQINSNDLINPEKYITSFGKLLREYSLDEIPQNTLRFQIQPDEGIYLSLQAKRPWSQG